MKGKKLFVLMMAVMFLSSGLMLSPAAYADEYKENILDQAWDGITTMGKSGMEKDQILAKNKAERVQRYAEKQAKKAQKEAEKAGKDLQKKLGF